jgi:hypothetical protein
MAEAKTPQLAINMPNKVKIYEVDDYEFMQNAYKGAGGFKTGEYLIPHPRETVDKFERRKNMAYYLNYVKTVVDSHVNPVFRKNPERMWGVNNEGGPTPLFDKFMEDTDTAGTSIDRFMKRAAKEAKKHGIVFIVVDNFSQQPDLQVDAIDQRILPYAYLVPKKNVVEYKTDGAGKITMIKYAEVTETSSGKDNKVTYWKWTAETWEKSAEGDTQTGTNVLGKIPVVPLFSGDHDTGELNPDSEFYSIARTNAALFNLCSWIDEMLQNQGFAILTYPVGTSQQAEDLKEIIVGTENVLGFDGTLSNAPSFIAPPGEMATALQSERSNLIQEIYRMAILSHVTGVAEQKSGVAKAWDFETTNMVLSDFAQNCEQAERQVAELVALYAGEDAKFSTAYSRDFGIEDVLGSLAEIQAGKDLMIGGKFDAELNKKAAATMLNDIPDDDYDAVIQDIESKAEEKAAEPVVPIGTPAVPATKETGQKTATKTALQ